MQPSPDNPGARVEHLEGTERQKSRSFSPAVITEGGRIVWLAGQTAVVDLQGRDIAGDFEAQAHTVFALLDRTLQRAGGSLANMVTMTVFIDDPRNGDRFVELRARYFTDGRYPGSALITVSNFARPGIQIEIQGVAVICSARPKRSVFAAWGRRPGGGRRPHGNAASLHGDYRGRQRDPSAHPAGDVRRAARGLRGTPHTGIPRKPTGDLQC
jgi:enamine deaminase RidA (YjgF/YER057c/UK114 family)